MDAKQTRLGIILALAAYFIWGIAPAYFKLIYYVPADEILTHRVIWSFFFMVALISVSRQWPQVKKLLKTPRKIFLLALSAVLVGGNWLLFIWAVNNHHMLEASLGYFINPLVNILLGMIFLGERFRRLQWLAVILAFCGVLVQLWTFGSLPIIGLGLAFSFAFTAWCGRKSLSTRRPACWWKRCGYCRWRQSGCLASLIARPAIWGEPLVAQSAADGRGRGHDHSPAVLHWRGNAPAALHAGLFPVHRPNADVPAGGDVLRRSAGQG